jgi:hypothetical protein
MPCVARCTASRRVGSDSSSARSAQCMEAVATALGLTSRPMTRTPLARRIRHVSWPSSPSPMTTHDSPTRRSAADAQRYGIEVRKLKVGVGGQPDAEILRNRDDFGVIGVAGAGARHASPTQSAMLALTSTTTPADCTRGVCRPLGHSTVRLSDPLLPEGLENPSHLRRAPPFPIRLFGPS